MHGPGGGGSSALNSRPSLGSGGVGGRYNNSGESVVLVSNLNEQVFVNCCILCISYNYSLVIFLIMHLFFYV